MIRGRFLSLCMFGSQFVVLPSWRNIKYLPDFLHHNVYRYQTSAVNLYEIWACFTRCVLLTANSYSNLTVDVKRGQICERSCVRTKHTVSLCIVRDVKNFLSPGHMLIVRPQRESSLSRAHSDRVWSLHLIPLVLSSAAEHPHFSPHKETGNETDHCDTPVTSFSKEFGNASSFDLIVGAVGLKQKSRENWHQQLKFHFCSWRALKFTLCLLSAALLFCLEISAVEISALSWI